MTSQAADSPGPSGTSAQDATRLIEAGHVLEAQGRFDEAMQHYQEAVRLAPNPARAHLNRGNVLLLKGDLQGALDAFRTALEHQPDYAGAYYNIGNALLGNGRFDEAARNYRLALKIKPDYAEVHCALGVALKNLGQTDDAIASLQRALQTDPGLAEAHSNLGQILQDLYNTGNVQLNAGNPEQAAASFRLALKVEPNLAEAHYHLGIALQDLGLMQDAAASYTRAVELKPDFAEAYNNLGLVLKDLGQFENAMASFRKAFEIRPGFAEAHNNLGLVLKDLGQFENAMASFRKTFEIRPGFAEAHNNLGIALQDFGQLDNAAASYRRAIEFKPDFAEAHSNLGIALQSLGQLEDAVSSFRLALKHKPDFVEAHSNLGIALQILGQLEGAVASYRRAVELKPDYAKAHSNLGSALKDLGQLADALACYRRALEIKPDYIEAYSNLLYLHAFARDISPESECILAADWERIALAENERSSARIRAFDHPPRAGRKLKVGIVSAEIGQHAVAEFLEPILEQLDRSRFHVTLFPTVVRTESRAARLKGLADEFRLLVGLPDNRAADLIRSERIDILIDTTSHMSGCRLGIFAHRAAPVQCHYIGYHGTTGLSEMDWFIADEVLLPVVCDTHFRENIWRLPRLWISYRGDALLPKSQWQPSIDGTVWLGSFNNLAKVGDQTLTLWAKVMNAIPESRLLLKDRRANDHATQERIRKELYRHGIGGDRIQFVGQTPDWRAHMALYDKLDIALDTIPLNSGTTAFDALWMGVPLIGMEGNWMGARMTNAILKALDKPEWVAHSEDEYVSIVTALARNVKERIALRSSQRALMAASPLCDAREMTRALETAFESMFDRWHTNASIPLSDVPA